MSNRNDECLLFIVEWLDPMPLLIRKYLLKYYVEMHQVEMIDIKQKKQFLKKSPCPPEINSNDFFIGSKINIYGRDLTIVDYGDLKTKDKFYYQIQSCMIILTQSSYQYWGSIITSLSKDLSLIKLKSILISSNIAERITEILELNGRNIHEFASGTNVVMLFHGEDGFNKIQKIANNLSSGDLAHMFYYSSNNTQSTDLQRLLITDGTTSATHPSSATYDSCTCCVIKPHAVKDKLYGQIIDTIISQGYEISAIKSIQFEKVQAEEFLEVYKGVIPTYMDHVTQLSLGTSIALEVRAQYPVETFRETAGPWDVELAKDLRPETLRGKFGQDNIRSAIHCTDLPQDGVLDCEYCFKLLA